MADANARRNHRQNIRRKDDRDRRSPRPIASDWCQAICVVRKNFGRVVVLDFEYEIDTNLLPNVLCMVAYVLDENLRHVRTIRLWRGEFGSMPPFDIGSDTLIIAYSAWAEMTCFKVLNWKFPVHIFDLHTAYLAASNVLVPYEPDETRKKPRKRVLHWSNYSTKTTALIQVRGIPWDLSLWNLVQENKAAVIRELIRQFDPSQGDDDPIYTPDGEWSYARFERWLLRNGITVWPRKDSGKLEIDSDAFRLMYHLPGIEGLHALRDCIGFIAKAQLPIGADGRNHPSLFPFCTATGRNAHAKSPFNAHAGVRSFIVFPPDRIGVYLDFRTQEVGIAATRSGDTALMDAYRSGDVYHALACTCGFTDDLDRVRWKHNNAGMRQRMKTLQLGINYGMGVPSLARGLNRHSLIASGIIEQHRRIHPRFWQWRDEMVMTAMLDRRIESVFGWPLRITTSPNKRTLYNFPMQADAYEMLRLAAWRLCEAGIVPCMLIHDGILFELNNREEIEQAKEIMRVAGRDVCDGFEIGVDVDQMLVGGARYSDKRPMAKKMWATIMSVLETIGAIPRRA